MGSGRMSAASDLCLAEEGLHPTFSPAVSKKVQKWMIKQTTARLNILLQIGSPRCRMYVYHNGMKASDIDGRYGANLGQRSPFHAGVG